MDSTTPFLPTTLILGGGFGGVRLARALCADRARRIVLMTNKPHICYYAALYRTATGRDQNESALPLNAAFPAGKVETIQDTAVSVDLAGKTVTGATGTTIRYDVLVVAVGADVAYFGIPGMQEHAYTLKSLQDALRLRSRVTEVFTVPPPDDAAAREARGRFVVAGGGPAGVELAGALLDYARSVATASGWSAADVSVHVVEAMPRVLPMLAEAQSAAVEKRLQKMGIIVSTGNAITSYDGTTLKTKNGDLPAATVIWTAGVQANALLKAIPGIETDKRGRIVTEDGLRIKGAKDAFVLGDAASTQYTGLAQTAVYDADFTASVLLGTKTAAYAAPKPAIAVPVGHGWALVEYKGMRFTGVMGWWLRRLADLHAFHLLLPLPAALRAFLAGMRKT